MKTTNLSEEIKQNRRRFLRNAAMTVAATKLLPFGYANAQSSAMDAKDVPSIKPGTNTSFAPLKHVDAGVLSIAYAEAGSADGPPARARQGAGLGERLSRW